VRSGWTNLYLKLHLKHVVDPAKIERKIEGGQMKEGFYEPNRTLPIGFSLEGLLERIAERGRT
jgi:hypothetical protein